MTDIINITGSDYRLPAAIATESNEAVVSQLEKLLELARNNQITGIVSCVTYSDNTQNTEYSGACVSRATVGLLELAKLRIANDLLEDNMS